jgi:hypothetical protein
MSAGAVEKAQDQDHGGHAHLHHDRHAPVHEHVHRPAVRPPSRQSNAAALVLAPSLLRLGIGERLLIAGGLIALVWVVILGVLS